MNKKINLGLVILAVLYISPVLAMSGQGHDKAQQGANKAKQHADKKQKMATKDDKFNTSNQQATSKEGQNSLLNQAGLALVISSSGISIQQAQQLAGQYQVSGGRQLPPGIRKQLARGKPLPPGIAKKVTQPDFLAALPQHQGYEWQICGSDLVLVAIATSVIADVLADVF